MQKAEAGSFAIFPSREHILTSYPGTIVPNSDARGAL